MKALKVLGIIVLLLVVAAAVFWFGWVKAPPAQDVCDNISAVMEKEAGSKLDDGSMKECIARYSKTPEFGMMPWSKKLKCLRDADSLAGLEKCGK
ncbi:MAG: hypothetical protein AB1Z98_04635 [Nannocystaceae bacterium]